ncbi:MAG: cob(I)yrinic acid a,c-diamide adenosyltransferase [Chloroflexota bacterium]
MPKLTKIYTKTGDDGTTALGSRRRVPKDDLRIEAYGTVDELAAFIGLALAADPDQSLVKPLRSIQNQLFHLGSDLAFPEEDKKQFEVPRIEERHILALEELIDGYADELGPLENFILPGGTPAAAALQTARAVCRRAERVLVSLARVEKVNPLNQQFLNRLSDALFIIGRIENKLKGVEDPLWDSHA